MIFYENLNWIKDHVHFELKDLYDIYFVACSHLSSLHCDIIGSGQPEQEYKSQSFHRKIMPTTQCKPYVKVVSEKPNDWFLASS